MPDKPERIKITNEIGQKQSLETGEAAFVTLRRGQDVLLLGLGPDPAVSAGIFESAASVTYMECPEFSRQMPDTWRASIPDAWREISPHALTAEIIKKSRICLFRQNPRLFPSFWGPVLADLRQAQAGPPAQPSQTALAWLTTGENSLLHRELTHALENAGVTVRHTPDKDFLERLPGLLTEARPSFLFSVNFQGLDPWGEVFHLLDRADVPVAVWLVDNPFNQLSGLKSGFWKQCRLFVTDDWFIGPLRRHGAAEVVHLPLAAWPEGFMPKGEKFLDLADRLVFVGRSEFPHKKSFFAGESLPPETWDKALRKLQLGDRPDFAWWWRALGEPGLWPGRDVRKVGFCADETGRAWRTMVLRAAEKRLPLTIFGDENWKRLVPSADLRPGIDYYGPLADIYANAGYNLNVTGMLLPSGLTQRHFDVWSAGGVLLSDATPGLEIFPSDLTEEITFASAEDLSEVVKRLEKDAGLKGDLVSQWRDLILSGHTYKNRADTILERLS